MSNQVPVHSDTCSSVIVRCIYDTACPRCTIINKIVHLKRKRTTLGCSLNEQIAAERAAQLLTEKYGLAPAEVVDRLYEKERLIAEGKRPVPKKRSAMSKAQWKAQNGGFGITVYQDEGVIIQDL